MKEFLRLLSYGRRYTAQLAISVVLMGVALALLLLTRRRGEELV